MPTVFRSDGLRVLIYLPGREHEPPHVHIQNATGEVVIELAVEGRRQRVRNVAGMRANDVAAAFGSLNSTQSIYWSAGGREYHG